MAFDPSKDAEILHKAVNGLGTKEEKIIETLSSRTSLELGQIAASYEGLYGKTLLNALVNDTSGDFQHAIVAIAQPPELSAARGIRHSIRGLGTDEGTVLEILCTQPSKAIARISDAYYKRYHRALLEDIVKDTSGGFKDLVVALLTVSRDEETVRDSALAKVDAEALYKAGPKKLGTDLKVYNQIFAGRSLTHLREVLGELENLAKKPAEDVIKSETSGDTEMAFLTMIKIIRNRPAFFAERIKQACAGWGTKEEQLTRAIISARNLGELPAVMREFENAYGKNLKSFVTSETSGDYRNLILAVLNKAEKLP